MSVFYNNYHEELGKGSIDYTSDTFYLMLMTEAYTPDIDTEAFRSDLSNESSGTNYTAGGQEVASVTWTQNNTDNRAVLDFADEVYLNVTLPSVAGGVLYKRTGADTTDILICYFDFTGGDQSVAANDFTVTPDAAGVLTNG
jgi:hypothetical protein